MRQLSCFSLMPLLLCFTMMYFRITFIMGSSVSKDFLWRQDTRNTVYFGRYNSNEKVIAKNCSYSQQYL